MLPPQPSLTLQNIINSNSTCYHDSCWMPARACLKGSAAPSGCPSSVSRPSTLNNHGAKETKRDLIVVGMGGSLTLSGDFSWNLGSMRKESKKKLQTFQGGMSQELTPPELVSLKGENLVHHCFLGSQSERVPHLTFRRLILNYSLIILRPRKDSLEAPTSALPLGGQSFSFG